MSSFREIPLLTRSSGHGKTADIVESLCRQVARRAEHTYRIQVDVLRGLRYLPKLRFRGSQIALVVYSCTILQRVCNSIFKTVAATSMSFRNEKYISIPLRNSLAKT